MTEEEIIKTLNMHKAAFTKWVNEGVIVRRQKGEYEVGVVFQEILHKKDTRNRELSNQNASISKQLNNAHKKIAELEAGGQTTPETRKKEVDIELKKRQIRKMDMDERIRRKDYIPVELLNDVVAALARQLADDLTQIPMKMKRLVPDMKASVFEEIKLFLSKTRNTMADYETGRSVQQHIDRYNPKHHFDSTLDTKGS